MNLSPLTQHRPAVHPALWLRALLALLPLNQLAWGYSLLSAPMWALLLSLQAALCLAAAWRPVRFKPALPANLALTTLLATLLSLDAWLEWLPAHARPWLLINTAIWLAILAATAWSQAKRSAAFADQPAPHDPMSSVYSTQGETLESLSADHPLLVVFLRHAGCTFCREALADLRQLRPSIEAAGTRIALVHMSPGPEAHDLFTQYGLGDLPQFSDPTRSLYRAFELEVGSFRRLLGPRVLWRGFLAAIIHRHGVGRISGNVFQMPGVFLIEKGKVVRAYRHFQSSDRPDYSVLSCPADLNQ